MDAGGRSTRLSRRARLARAALALLALAAAALFVSGRVLRPPVLMQATRLAPELVRGDLPAGSERVEIALDRDTTLRGWYVPADAGAALVLHLLESTASTDSRHSSRALVANQLADLGFASLALDYAGVGASSGERATANLGRDARAMWDEALRRVDGDPRRVVLRCMSIGTLAALPLLDGGARPAGVILLLPVLPDTLAERFARSFHGRLAGWFARAAFRPVLDQDPFAVLAATPTEWLAVQAERDQMTSAAERAAIDAAITAAGGRTARLDDDHLVGTLALRALSDAELAFLTEVVPGVRDVEARWERLLAALGEDERTSLLADEPRRETLAALAAWSQSGEPLALQAVAHSCRDGLLSARIRWWLAAERYTKLATEDLRYVADLDDPAGAIPLEVVLEASRMQDLQRRSGMGVGGPLVTPSHFERAAREAVAGAGRPLGSVSTDFGGKEIELELHPGKLLARLASTGITERDARRQLARVLLKTYAIPDRCGVGVNGDVVLEYRRQGVWRGMQPDPEATALAADDTAWVFPHLGLDASVQD